MSPIWGTVAGMKPGVFPTPGAVVCCDARGGAPGGAPPGDITCGGAPGGPSPGDHQGFCAQVQLHMCRMRVLSPGRSGGSITRNLGARFKNTEKVTVVTVKSIFKPAGTDRQNFPVKLSTFSEPQRRPHVKVFSQQKVIRSVANHCGVCLVCIKPTPL